MTNQLSKDDLLKKMKNGWAIPEILPSFRTALESSYPHGHSEDVSAKSITELAARRYLGDSKNLKRNNLLRPENARLEEFEFWSSAIESIGRGEERRIKPLSEVEFVLQDYDIRFSHPGAFEGMGFASLHQSKGSKTYGVLYTLKKSDLIRLDFYELVPFLGRYERVELTQDGKTFYIYQSKLPREGLKPTQNYLDSILSGYRRLNNVPKEYLDQIRSVSTLRDLQPAKDIAFLFQNLDAVPEFIRPYMKSLDRKAVKFSVSKIKEMSLTERFIRV